MISRLSKDFRKLTYMIEKGLLRKSAAKAESANFAPNRGLSNGLKISLNLKRLNCATTPLADQLQRAGTSVPLNIAEGSGEHAASEKARFYRMAKRSATECASILDVCKRLRLLDEDRYGRGRDLLLRIVAMLTRMAHLNVASDRGSV